VHLAQAPSLGAEKVDPQRNLQGESRVCAIQIEADDLGDTLQAIVERVAVYIEPAGSLAGIGVLLEIRPERGHQLGVVLPVILHQQTERVTVKAAHFGLIPQPKQQAVETEIGVEKRP